MPNNELFKLAPMASQDYDTIAFLSLDIPMLGVYDLGASATRISTCMIRFTPLAAAPVADTGIAERWTTLRSSSGGTELTPPHPVDWGSGEARRRGYLTREQGGRGRTACMAIGRRSRIGGQMLRPG
jgi:hypothetical protein